MDPYNETFETWNKLAQLYQERFMDLDIYNETYDFISRAMPPHAKILEIGCGPGNITKYLLSARPDFDIFGIDVAPNMVALAAKNNPPARFAIMDCRKINEIQNKYNGIVCGFCLPYLSQTDCRKLVADCYTLLNDNGLLYLSFVEGDPDKSGFQVGSSGHRSYFYFHDRVALQTMLYETGFDEPRVFKVVYKKSVSETEIHVIFIARKKTTT